MELELSEEQEAKLQIFAKRMGKNPSDLLLDAVLSVIDLDEYHLAAIDRAIAQIDRGEFIEEEAMDARVAKMLAR